ncbi:helix-turn-helix domain-containing protein [Streptomyces sp. NPDC088124]|uniref:PucR family transcriptional regulator n=1 Tax=Streptomyces sp. NPDC088124 TaxID=3154654 RepID=UPI00343CCF16
MTVTHQREPVTGILRAMALDPAVCGELVHAARSRSPEVARLAEAENRRHVTALVTAAGQWAATFDRVEEQNFAAALLLGADRAGQAVPVTAVLRGVQAALTRAVEITVDRGRAAGITDGLLIPAVLRLKEYGDAVERHVVHGYRTAEQGAPHPADGARARVLRQLLAGGAPPGPDELARAGLRPGSVRHCLVMEAAGPGHPRPPTPGAAAGPGSPCGDFARVEGCLVGLCARPPSGDEIAPGALAVLSPALPLDALRPAYRLCARALDLGARRGWHGMYELTDFAAEIALADQPLLGTYLTRGLLGSLDPSDEFHRQLALTALTFLDHGRRLDQTAATLFTHPNTVRYRLGRLQQITGESLTDPRYDGRPGPLATLHWWWALTTWLRPDPGPGPDAG